MKNALILHGTQGNSGENWFPWLKKKLEEKGYISSHIEKEGKMPEKSVYSLTEKGKQQFEKLMLEISCKPINIFLDFNAVIVNLDSMSRERQQECLDRSQRDVCGE